MPTRPLSERSGLIRFSPIKEVVGRVAAARSQGIEIANFSAGRPDFDTPAHVKEAAAKALRQGLVHYSASPGIEPLREAVCLSLARDFGLTLEPSQVIITAGSTEAIHTALQTILNPGDEVLAPQPMYVYYEGWAALAGGRAVLAPLRPEDGFGISAQALEPLITEKTKALYLNTPHNPTGRVFGEEELRAVAALAVERDFFVICDDIYNYFLYEGAVHHPLLKFPGMAERSIIIGSFSKTYAMDGWRIGFLIAPPEVAERAIKMHQFAVNSSNTFIQHGAVAALTGPQDCVAGMVAEYDRRRLYMLSALDAMGLEYSRPKGAFYVFPSIRSTGMSSARAADYLFQEARVAVVPGQAFGPGGEGHVRMAYCIPFEEIEQGLERMARALKKI